MDSLTQAALGAAVAVALAPKAPKKRMILYGAALGTMPDLDVLMNPFVSDVQAVVAHRSATHSLICLPFVALLLAYLAGRWRLAGMQWKQWTWVTMGCLLTHPLLDGFTSYGTQMLWPISRTPFSTSSIFIIDPLYSLPIMAALIALWRERLPEQGSPGQVRAISPAITYIRLALLWGCLYLGLGLGIKLWQQHQLRAWLDSQGAQPEIAYLQPTLANLLLWRAIVIDTSGNREILYWLWEGFEQDSRWEHLPKHPQREHLTQLMGSSESHQRLLEFSRGLYQLQQLVDGTVIFADRRFPFPGEASDTSGSLFSFRIGQQATGGRYRLYEPIRLSE